MQYPLLLLLPVLPLLLPSPASPHPRRATSAFLCLVDFQKLLFGFGCCRRPCFSITREKAENRSLNLAAGHSSDCIVWLHDPCCVASSSLHSQAHSPCFSSFLFFSPHSSNCLKSSFWSQPCLALNLHVSKWIPLLCYLEICLLSWFHWLGVHITLP